MAYKKAIIAIPNVTGNIAINVTTQGSVQNLFDINNSILNTRIGATGDIKPEGDTQGMIVTNLIDLDNLNSVINFSGVTFVKNTSRAYTVREVTYDSSLNLISHNNNENPIYSIDISNWKTAHPDIKYVRFGLSIKNGVSITASDVANLMITGS